MTGQMRKEIIEPKSKLLSDPIVYFSAALRHDIEQSSYWKEVLADALIIGSGHQYWPITMKPYDISIYRLLWVCLADLGSLHMYRWFSPIVCISV